MTFVSQPYGCFPREGGRDLRRECFIVRVPAQALGAGSGEEGVREAAGPAGPCVLWVTVTDDAADGRGAGVEWVGSRIIGLEVGGAGAPPECVLGTGDPLGLLM